MAPTSVRGTRVGVFVGASAAGYAMAGVLPEGSESHAMTGTSNSVLSGRISYTFGLEARRSPSTRRVRRRWWRCTWRRSRCAPASAPWRSRAA
nr:beta-ketoacyl synthase N-terminal-like domain-containing protein [Streptomyces sp. H-KF8]